MASTLQAGDTTPPCSITAELRQRRQAAIGMAPPGVRVQHVTTGAIYYLQEFALRESDIALLALYSADGAADVMFACPFADFTAQFVRVDGEPWGAGR